MPSQPPTCPSCSKPTPAAEVRAYGRCEDCWASYVARAYGLNLQPSRLVVQHPTGRRKGRIGGPAH